MLAIKAHYEGGGTFVDDDPLPPSLKFKNVTILINDRNPPQKRESIDDVCGCLRHLYKGPAIPAEEMGRAIPIAIAKSWNQ